MVKTTEIEFKLILDINMHLLIEKGMRGGILYIAKRYSKANNKYMTNYDSSKESKSIVYLDADNFYGWAISQYLPYGEFKWLSQKEIGKFDVNLISKFDGYILEFHLEYPDELRVLHNDYPLVAKKLEISNDMLS